MSFAVVQFLRSQGEGFQIGDATLDVLGAAIISLILIIMSVYLLLSGRIDRADLNHKTKALELEYRVTELEEILKKDVSGRSDC